MKKKKIAVFDIDGTIFRSSVDQELFEVLIEAGKIPENVLDEVKEKHQLWLNRKGPYNEYSLVVYYALAKSIAGQKTDYIKGLCHKIMLDRKDRVYVYTRDLIEKIREDHLLIAISGSPTILVEEFAKHYGFDASFGSDYAIKDGVFTGEFETEMYYIKKDILLKYVEENDLSLKDSIGVGDTFNDVQFLDIVDNPIAFNPNQELYDHAKKSNYKIVVERKNVIHEI